MDTDVSTTVHAESAATAQDPAEPTEQPQHLVVMGVAGSGKTTVATLLAQRLGTEYAEADQFHPQANIEKMSAGTPLTDEDRWPWLEAIRDWLSAEAEAGRSGVVTCSALKRSYRDLLRTARGRVCFVHLDGSPELLAERMEHRSGHFMPTSLLPSQLATLEPLDDDEPGFTVDVTRTPEEIADLVLDRRAGCGAAGTGSATGTATGTGAQR
ncbi:gluconate kinase [Cellulosimicrobium cellulans]|uniref:Gluconokinase n=1 Tax=Cellulosimicrobium cellulans TaxID=1710 RepID=A0A1Y0HSU7_CELCE|nr:gluconokinase [Cellulosimicrobium cellulans]ARU51040.1 gluconate kinase [Cellulosimicrobium cellulans]